MARTPDLENAVALIAGTPPTTFGALSEIVVAQTEATDASPDQVAACVLYAIALTGRVFSSAATEMLKQEWIDAYTDMARPVNTGLFDSFLGETALRLVDEEAHRIVTNY